MGFELAAFIGVIFLGQFSPGPDMILLTRISLGQGAKQEYWAATGIACGLAVHSFLAIGGMAQLFAAGGMLSLLLRVLSAFYLGYLAWRLLQSRKQTKGTVLAPKAGPKLNGFRAGFLCNVLNPKVVVFFAAAITPFLAKGHPAWWPWLLGTLIVAQGWLLWLLWVRLLQKPRIQAGYVRWQYGINTVFSLVLVALAVKLLWTALG